LTKYTFREWQEVGYDKDSEVVEEPVLYDYMNGDFRGPPDSPASKIGFKDIDMSWGLTDDFPAKWRD